MSDGVFLVQGTEPTLRDLELQRLVDELLEGADRSLAFEEHSVPARPRADGDAGREAGDAEAVEQPLFAAIQNACESPAFLTPHRVVVVREIGNLSKEQAAWLAEYVGAPLDTTRLVLVAGGGKTPAALDKALKAVARVVGPASESTAEVLARTARDHGVRLSGEAAERVVRHFGEDAGRVPEFVDVLHAAFGDGAEVGAEEVGPFLGELGTADAFALTNAIEKGEVAAALEVLHRYFHATSGVQRKSQHPMQVMAAIVGHYQRLLRLDDPAITTNAQAAEVLGMKSAPAAGYRLRAAKALGTEGLREAYRLLARAELDLRGESGVDDEVVMEVLVARLANLTRRHARGGAGAARRR